MNGIINIYKEQGFTSHDVVAKLRGIFHIKKIGHTGTLDPDAVGVLPVCVGKATKVCDFLADRDKTYIAVVKLGVITDTLDMSGTVLKESLVQVTEKQIISVFSDFIGVIDQIPPMYSAIKINGKKLYELARKGQEVERKPRQVTIYELLPLAMNLEKDEFTIQVTCSKGTYIRSLCHDIGERLGCGAAMKSLVRTRVGRFVLEEAKTLSEVEEICQDNQMERLLLPIDSVFEQYSACRVSEQAMKYLKNGNAVASRFCDYTAADGEKVRMYSNEDEFYAIYRYDDKDSVYRVVKMFHE